MRLLPKPECCQVANFAKCKYCENALPKQKCCQNANHAKMQILVKDKFCPQKILQKLHHNANVTKNTNVAKTLFLPTTKCYKNAIFFSKTQILLKSKNIKKKCCEIANVTKLHKSIFVLFCSLQSFLSISVCFIMCMRVIQLSPHW